jgi:hypothetical protein
MTEGGREGGREGGKDAHLDYFSLLLIQELSEATRADPHDVRAWRAYIRFQKEVRLAPFLPPFLPPQTRNVFVCFD